LIGNIANYTSLVRLYGKNQYYKPFKNDDFKSYKLSMKEIGGEMVKVERFASLYKEIEEPETLNDGDIIYQLDSLRITYDLGEEKNYIISIDGKNIENGHVLNVENDINIIAIKYFYVDDTAIFKWNHHVDSAIFHRIYSSIDNSPYYVNSLSSSLNPTPIYEGDIIEFEINSRDYQITSVTINGVTYNSNAGQYLVGEENMVIENVTYGEMYKAEIKVSVNPEHLQNYDPPFVTIYDKNDKLIPLTTIEMGQFSFLVDYNSDFKIIINERLLENMNYRWNGYWPNTGEIIESNKEYRARDYVGATAIIQAEPN
jgi:hypothetical protein